MEFARNGLCKECVCIVHLQQPCKVRRPNGLYVVSYSVPQAAVAYLACWTCTMHTHRLFIGMGDCLYVDVFNT